MFENERDDRFRRRARLARPFLFSFIAFISIGSSISKLWSSNGLPGALTVIFFGMALISAMLGLGALEMNHKPPSDLAVRINELSENLTRSGTLIAEISAEMQLQTAAFERISAEAEQNRHLASLHQNEADAVRRVIENAQTKGVKITSRQQWLFFLGGIPVGVIVNFIYGYLTQTH